MLRVLLATALVLTLLVVIGIIAWSRIGVMAAEPEPLHEVLEDPRITVTDSDTALLLEPAGTGAGDAGLVFYPGAKVAPEAYAARLSGLVTEHGMTVVQALSRSGGVTQRGSSNRVEIRRRDADGQFVTLRPELTDLVQADDVILIKERIF